MTPSGCEAGWGAVPLPVRASSHVLSVAPPWLAVLALGTGWVPAGKVEVVPALGASWLPVGAVAVAVEVAVLAAVAGPVVGVAAVPGPCGAARGAVPWPGPRPPQ